MPTALGGHVNFSLWSGLPTVPPGATAGLPHPVRGDLAVGRVAWSGDHATTGVAGLVGRPCHNEQLDYQVQVGQTFLSARAGKNGCPTNLPSPLLTVAGGTN
jgi:hypothetical protein